MKSRNLEQKQRSALCSTSNSRCAEIISYVDLGSSMCSTSRFWEKYLVLECLDPSGLGWSRKSIHVCIGRHRAV